MDYRQPKFNVYGTIDMDVFHPIYGWIAYTASPVDSELQSRQLYATAYSSAAAYVAPPPLTPEERRAEMPSITPRQLRLTLNTIGITEDAIDALLVNDPDGRTEWKWATSFTRTHTLINIMGAVFSITPEQIDDLWVFARAI
ncbi:hypothetical protein [Mesorhizobium sp. M7A.F.Ca.CA.004.02.1.1]|uniref:hypothetical protein n=1 Tax=Mesorhizobium sp. M7A.F.Ca.CA.004.02.1.1 TaxID=2496690 RepID=UPI000FCA424D|nr:hypothetical protein [Mesorhizobium sp. M7A.F.Ca.CA.004.02.1.1]RVB05684.1 hypothetical protein EN912_02155 [Mesorhizobium sp. M7A.F.Ca.CA.004.02.1.1]